MDVLKLLLERLLSWPVITFFTFLVFKKPLTSLLNRINILKAGKEGFSLDASVAVAIQAEAKVGTGLKTSEAEQRLEVVKNFVISPSVRQREEWIRADLLKMNLVEPIRQETVDLLIQHLAFMQAQVDAERVYRTIFGSQIALLKTLNILGAVSRAGLETVYDTAKSRFPELYNKYSFQQWLNYLLEHGLLSSTDHEQYSITGDGREFLKWMMDIGVTEDKSF